MQSITFVKPVSAINTTIKFWFIVVGSILFNLLFWNEKIAINASLFFLFTVGGILYFYPNSLNNKKVKWLLFASGLSLVMVIWHNTFLSKLAFTAALFLMAAFAQYSNNSLLYAGGSVLQSFLFFFPSFFISLKSFSSSKRKKTGIGKKITLAFFPILILMIFICFYLNANKVFADLVEKVTNKFEWVFAHLLNWIEPQRLLFLGLGLWISGGLLVRYLKAPLEKVEKQKDDLLLRKRKGKYKKGFVAAFAKVFLGKFATRTMALKNECISGLICLILLNVLLLLVNATDILYVWFSFTYTPDMDLTKFVHDGAELLVVSIMSAMLVVLFFFRGNLNFFSKNKYLKILSYTWIFQNAILAVSLCIRNVYYIQYWSLAYKRVGLFFYILLVIIGLISIIIKIRKRKSSYYLWRVNAMAAFIVLVVSSSVDWDYYIANYNLKRKDSIPCDIGFILQMNDNVLPLLEQNKAWICKQNNQSGYTTGEDKYDGRITYCQMLANRETAFLIEQKKYSWLSWNYADEYTKLQLATLK